MTRSANVSPKCVFCTFMLSTFLLATIQAEVRYTITDLSPLEGKGNSPCVINNSGQVTGVINDRGVIWQDGQITELNFIPKSINDQGEVVGNNWTQDGHKAFFWKNGEVIDLTQSIGAVSSQAYFINTKGQILMDASFSPGQPDMGIWENGSFTNLGKFEGQACFPLCINNNGDIVAYRVMKNSQASGAFLYTSGEFIDLRTSEMSDPYPFFINEARQVVIYDVGKIFLWQNSQVTSIEILPGFDGGGAMCINNYGQIVGGVSKGSSIGLHDSTEDGSNYQSAAFLWENGVITNLNDLVDPASGYNLTYAVYINDRGQILATGKINEESRVFLLTPISPEGLDVEKNNAPSWLSGLSCTPAILFMAGFLALSFTVLGCSKQA